MEKLQKMLARLIEYKPVAGEKRDVRKEKERQLKRCCSFPNIRLLVEANERQRDALKLAVKLAVDPEAEVTIKEIDELIAQAESAIDRLDV